MEILFGFITIGAIGLLGAMSPGPDFAVVTKNSILFSRRAGLYTALGIGLGIFVHVAYSLVGIGFIISQSILLFSIIKYIGAAYLVYLGIQLLRTKKSDEKIDIQQQSNSRSILNRQALWNGFLTNALNPKVTLFFLSIFTQVISPSTPLVIQAAYGIEIAVIAFVWFAILALILTTTHVKKAFFKFHYYVAKVMGGILVALGIKVALTTNH